MRKIITPILLFLIPLLSSAQVTFERLLPNFVGIEDLNENPDDGSFILATDSGGAYLVVLDRLGNRTSSFPLNLRLSDDRINTAVFSAGGGFAVGGYSRDTNLVYDDEPLVALINPDGSTKKIQMLPPGDLTARTTSMLQVPSGGFAAAVFEDLFGGSNTTTFYRLDDSLQTIWDKRIGGDGLDPRCVALLQPSGFTYARYSVTAANYPTVGIIDANGNGTDYSVPDTLFGGGLCFQDPVVDGRLQGGSFFGATLEPSSYSYTTGYLGLMDVNGQPIWEKRLDWGQSISVRSVASTLDGGCFLAVSIGGDLNFIRYNAAGDSLWSKVYTYGGGSVGCSKFRRCRDGGFILLGGASAFSSPLVTKFDTALQILPYTGLTITGNTTICPGDTVSLEAEQGYTYLWSNGVTTRINPVTEPGDYFVTIFDPGTGLSAVSDTITIDAYTVNRAIAASGSLEFCDGGSVTLNAPTGTDYDWSDGSTDPSITVDTSGDFWTTYVDGNGCSVQSDTVTVVEFPVPATPVITQAGLTLFSSPAAGYQWYLNGSPLAGETNQVLTPAAGGIYSVVITDGNGCTATSADFTFVFPGISEPAAVNGLFVNQREDRKLTVRVPLKEEASLRVIDLNGRVLFQQNLNGVDQLEIPSQDWPAGIYQVQWTGRGSTLVQPVFIR